MSEHRIPYEEVLPRERPAVPTFESGERANLWEMFQFDRWMKVAKKSAKGNSTYFERFFKEMMPPIMSYTWEKIDKRNQRKIRVFIRGSSNEHDEVVFTCIGTLKLIFEKLVNHYATNRESYFEERYHTKYLKVSLEKAMRIALNPPKAPPPEIIKEPVPGETVEIKVDGVISELEKVYNFFTSGQIDGNKALPNKWRHIKDIDVSYSFGGTVRVILELKP